MTDRPEQLESRSTPVHHLLLQAARHRPDAPAVRDEHGAWTYRDLLAHSARIADALRGQGVRPGQRVVGRLPNSRHAVALLYGVLGCGAVYVPVSTEMRPFLLRAVLADADPALVVLGPDENSGELPDQSGAEATASGQECHRRRPPHFTLPELLAEAERHAGRHASGTQPSEQADAAALALTPDPEDTALLLYTSGSTAAPKAVVCPHAQVSFAARAVSDRLGYRPGDVVYVRSPFSFDYGLYQVFLCALAGCELALTGKQPEVTLLRFARRFRATVLPLVPPTAHTLARLAARDRAPHSIRLITSTGAPLPAATTTRLREVLPGARIVAMYGMTECKRITIADPDDDVRHPGTSGVALPGTEVTIVDPSSGAVLPPGEVGEIVVRGPHVMSGYRAAPQADAHRFRAKGGKGERALHTGDLGRLNAHGRLTVLGRGDDVFKRRGHRTSSTEIEAAAMDIPEVAEAAVPPPETSGVLRIWAVTRLQAEEVLKLLTERLEPAKVPDQCIVLDALPRTAHGKIDKRRLQRATAGEDL